MLSVEAKPLVSIVTPTYEQVDFIEETIISVKNQNYPNIEHVVFDGGSGDGTKDILRDYEDIYNLRWFSEEDSGPAEACNKGFEAAEGELFAYLNSDDILYRDATEIAVKAMKQYPDCDVIYGDAYILDECSRVTGKMYSPPFFSPYLFALGGFSIAQQATFWKRSVYEEVGGFNEENRTCWDGEFWVDLALGGANFKHIDEFLGAFRHHSKSISVSGELRNQYKIDSQRIFNKVFNRDPTKLDTFILSPISKLLGHVVRPKSFAQIDFKSKLREILKQSRREQQ